MKTIIHNLNDGSRASITCTITKEGVSYLGINLEDILTMPLTKQEAIQMLQENHKTLQSTVR